MDCTVSRLTSTATGLFVYLVMATSTFGIVLQNDFQPTDRPDDAVVGAWASSASCVAISPNYVLTCRHQGGGVGTEIRIDGATYKVAEIINNPYQEMLGTVVDMRVARIETENGQPANLESYVGVYTGNKEVGQPVVFGGYGNGRGADLVSATTGEVYGYLWDRTPNTTLRWGTNIIDSRQAFYEGTYYVQGLMADFDELGQDDATEFEAAVADHDSGSGWFINDKGEWKVVGLSAYVEMHSPLASWFASTSTGSADPDWLGCVRVSPYSAWIEENISSVVVVPGDANWDGMVDITDLGILAANYDRNDATWQEGDFNADGMVDVADLGILAGSYGSTTIQFEDEKLPNVIPEPITAIFFLTGAWYFHTKSRYA